MRPRSSVKTSAQKRKRSVTPKAVTKVAIPKTGDVEPRAVRSKRSATTKGEQEVQEESTAKRQRRGTYDKEVGSTL